MAGMTLAERRERRRLAREAGKEVAAKHEIPTYEGQAAQYELQAKYGIPTAIWYPDPKTGIPFAFGVTAALFSDFRGHPRAVWLPAAEPPKRENPVHELSPRLAPPPQIVPTPREIQEVVGRHFGYTVAEIRGPSRREPLARIRMIAMYMTREMTTLSYPEIGRAFGNRHHTTAIHAYRTIAERVQASPRLWERILDLREQVLALHLEKLRRHLIAV